MKKTVIILFSLLFFSCKAQKEHKNIIGYSIDLKKQSLKFYLKDNKGKEFKNFESLKEFLASKSEKLVFAMNGGMYQKDNSPQGLYIENGIVKSQIDTLKNGYGNFYLQPNGIFYITTKNEGFVCKSNDFVTKNIKYATQSGPLLLIDGKIHPKLKKGSKNLHIRNGVGILPNGKILFAISKEKINFFDFATFFKSSGCKDALYLDGFVSRIYLPEKGYNKTNGNFGVIIAETEKRK